MKTISILGCGWLGFPLAKRLIDEGYEVKGSSRNVSKLLELEKAGIQSYQLDIGQLDQVEVSFWEADALILSIPPNRKDKTLFIEQLQELSGKIEEHKIPRVFYTSSIGVYPQQEKVMLEADASSDSFTRVIEKVFTDRSDLNLTILRLAGLMGGERHPGRFFAGKENVKGANAPINFVHLDDVVEVIVQLLSTKCNHEIFNVCAPLHPTRKEFYIEASKQLGVTMPTFDESDHSSGKIVSSVKLIEYLNYTFIHPNPLKAL